MTLQLFGALAAAPGFDVSGAAPWLWESGWAQKLGKRVSDTAARDAWWRGASKPWRQDQRVTYLAITRHAPKGLSVQKQNAWWGSIGKNKRKDLRDKYAGSSFFDDVIDVVTLSPILSKIPLISDIHAATLKLHKAPFNALVNVVNGERIDKAALKQFKDQLGAAKTLAPYAQTVVSFVPGIGTGLSAGLGAGLALAEGKPLDAALLAGVRGALPGGALAQAAFDVTTAVMAGKPVEQVAISVLPVSDAAKRALIEGAKVARAVAEGKRVDKALLDTAINLLPEAAGKAAQIGVAVGAGALAQKGGIKALSSVVDAAKKVTSSKAFKTAQKTITSGEAKKIFSQATQVAKTAQKNQAAITKASQAIQMFQRGKPFRLTAPRIQEVVRRVPALRKASAGNSDVTALRDQLNKLVAADKKEDAQQAAELQRLRELVARQQMQQPVYAQAPPVYAPSPAQQQYAYAMPPQPFYMQPVYGQPGMFAPQAVPMAAPPEAYQQQALMGLHGVLY